MRPNYPIENRLADEAELRMLRELVGVRADARACAADAQHWLKLMTAWDENVKLRAENASLRELHSKCGKTMLEYERLLLIAVNNINDADDPLQREILEAINRK